MMAAIFTIAAFQGYWLYKLYHEEYNNIQKQADVLLKQTVQQLQEKNIKTDSTFLRYFSEPTDTPNYNVVYDTIKETFYTKPKKIALANTNKLKRKDTLNNLSYVTFQSSKTFTDELSDSLLKNFSPNQIRRINFKKDSNNINTGTIIINSKYSGKFDSTMLAKLKNRNNDSLHNKKMAFKVDLDSLSIPKEFLSKIKPSRRISINKIDTNKMNFSNLVIRIFTDSIAPKKVDSVFKQTLAKEKVSLPFKLVAKRVLKENTNIIDTTKKSLHTSTTTIGLVRPMAYQAQFDNPFWFIVKRISLPITMSLLLLGFVTAAFIFLYRNMMAQKRLATMKSDFISNVTHELKTPIATVNVAIEALRNFNAMEDKKKSQDYLDISAMEINRLGLLVDNVLKLSMFENDKIELQKEQFDVVALTQEVINALSILIDKKQASVEVEAHPENIFIVADKLHITSILFNLIDNALKYSSTNPVINITLSQQNNFTKIIVADNGIGISKEHQQKIFNKFYRIQNGDRHNVKGYGLGLSYVNYIVKKHNGSIKVKSEIGKGSEFVIELNS